MDFCSSCGILLPLDLVGKPFCRPCERDRNQSSKDWVCQCVLCGKAKAQTPPPSSPVIYSDTPSSPRYDRNDEHTVNKSSAVTNSKSEKNNCKKSRSKRTTRRGDAEQKYMRFDECNSDNEDRFEVNANFSSQNFFDVSPMTPGFPVEPAKPWHEWDQQESHTGVLDLPDWSQSDVGDDGWTEVRKKRSHNPLFGDHDFPVLERGLKESAVLQSVRDDWEREQNELKCRLEMQDTPDITKLVNGHRKKSKKCRFYVGGVDISFIKDNTIACACLSVVRMPDLELVYQRMETIQMTQPYIPGFLAFREVPPLFDLFATMKTEAPQYIPDVIMVDGNGILHPRGFGLASHLGVVLNIPTIGVAKTLMTAQGITDDSDHKTKKHMLSQAAEGFDLISDSGEILGKCVRNHDEAPNPVYVSVGHKITLQSAVWLVLECSMYRIPEPIRRADLDSREYIRHGKTDPEVFIKYSTQH